MAHDETFQIKLKIVLSKEVILNIWNALSLIYYETLNMLIKIANQLIIGHSTYTK